MIHGFSLRTPFALINHLCARGNFIVGGSMVSLATLGHIYSLSVLLLVYAVNRSRASTTKMTSNLLKQFKGNMSLPKKMSNGDTTGISKKNIRAAAGKIW